MAHSESQFAPDVGGRFSFVIPVYNHERTVGDVALRASRFGLPVFVIDDGSTDATPEVLRGVEGITVVRHSTNRGKGAALLTGFAAASDVADWAITLDADGQHDPADAAALARSIPPGVRPIVLGRRRGMEGPAVPWTSRFGRKFSNFWVQSSGGPRASDTQSGFRIYPLPEALHLNPRSRRFQFEVEILVLAHWGGMPIAEGEITVNYRPAGERISHFRPWTDFWRNFETFSRLVAWRLLLSRSARTRRSQAARPKTPRNPDLGDPP